MDKKTVRLNHTLLSSWSMEFEHELKSRVIGQARAIRTVSRALQTWRSGLCSYEKPIASFLLLGPTGAGKTHLVRSVADVLFENPGAVLKIDCAEFQRSHEISKLLGSPPGYVGSDRKPRITNERLKLYHTEETKISLVLFDEIEKASGALWELLLGVLDEGTLTLGDGNFVDFTETMIFFTSNLASREMSELTGGGIGFHPGIKEDGVELDKKIYKTAKTAASHHFSPEFMNRLDRVIVFHSLLPSHMEKILDIELKKVQERIIFQAPIEKNFIIHYTDAARKFLLSEGTDAKYGARQLKRVIERHIVAPISNLMDTDQVTMGDVVTVDCNEAGELEFTNEVGGALIESKSPSQPYLLMENEE